MRKGLHHPFEVDSGNDAELIAGLRNGKSHAFEAVFRAYHARLCRFAYGYLQTEADAEEVVQDLFLALWRKHEQLQVTTSLSAYLFAAIRNRVLNRNARACLEQAYLEQFDRADLELDDPAEPADQAVEAAQLAERVTAALAELPPGCQRVLQLRWHEQLTYPEIAEVLGISVKGVENQLSRARKSLRQHLGEFID